MQTDISARPDTMLRLFLAVSLYPDLATDSFQRKDKEQETTGKKGRQETVPSRYRLLAEAGYNIGNMGDK